MLSEGGSKSWAHRSPGLRFISVSVSDLISEVFPFSSPNRTQWDSGDERGKSCSLPKDVSEGNNLHFHASPFLWWFEFPQVPRQDSEDMRLTGKKEYSTVNYTLGPPF